MSDERDRHTTRIERRTRKPSPARVTRRVPVLIGMSGTMRNKRFILRNQETLLGRDPEADIVVEDSGASRRHTRVLYNNCGESNQSPDCRLFDLDSTNGTFVNGDKVEPEGAWLMDRDRILIGETRFGFFVRDEEDLLLDGALGEEDLVCDDSRDSTTDNADESDPTSEPDDPFEREFEKAKKSGHPLAVALVEIDRLAEIDQHYGPLLAKGVLSRVEDLIENANRPEDVLTRHKDRRLLILYPNTSGEAAILRVEQVRAAIGEESFEVEETAMTFTASVGIASANWETETPLTLLERTARNLKNAVLFGGDRVEAPTS